MLKTPVIRKAMLQADLGSDATSTRRVFRRMLFAVCVILTCASMSVSVFGDLGSARAVVYDYYSSEREFPAWQKDVVTACGTNFSTLLDRQGVFAPKQEIIAESIAVSNMHAVAESYKEGFENGKAQLVAATNDMPRAGISIGLVCPLEPSESRTAIEGFIVEQSYDEGNNLDILTIHFTQDLKVQPRIVCPYVYDGGLTTNYLAGTFSPAQIPQSDWTNVYTVTLGDVDYDNCHKLYVQRPEFMRDATTWFNTNIRWGTDEGIDYGLIVHTAFGEPLYTGVLTNYENATWVAISDGAIVSAGFVKYAVVTNYGGSGVIGRTSDGRLSLHGAAGSTYVLTGKNLDEILLAEILDRSGNEGTPEPAELGLSYTNGTLTLVSPGLSVTNYVDACLRLRTGREATVEPAAISE